MFFLLFRRHTWKTDAQEKNKILNNLKILSKIKKKKVVSTAHLYFELLFHVSNCKYF